MVKEEGRIVTVKSTEKEITSRSGLLVLEKIATQLGLEKHLSSCFDALKQRERGLPVWRQILDFALFLADGGSRVEDFKVLKGDVGFAALRGGEELMAPRTALDLLHRFDEGSISDWERLPKTLLSEMEGKREEKTATLDVDATFIACEKEESRMSYHKERGFYPMLGYWAETGLCVQGEFRNGNESPGSKALSFLEKCLAVLPKGVEKIRVRSDSAWYQTEVMDFCDRLDIEFCIGGRKTNAMEHAIRMIPETQWVPWVQTEEEGKLFPERKAWEVAETVYSLDGSDRQYRLLLIRKPWKQLEMFAEVHDHDLLLTNMHWEDPQKLWRFYFERCASENLHKELKGGFSLDQLPCSEFLPNAAFFHIALLAYNLVQAFKLLKLDLFFRFKTVKTLRYHFFHVAGLVTRHARSLFLHLHFRYPHFQFFRSLLGTA